MGDAAPYSALCGNIDTAGKSFSRPGIMLKNETENIARFENHRGQTGKYHDPL